MNIIRRGFIIIDVLIDALISRITPSLMKKSAEITMESFETVKNNIKAGMEEVEVVGYVAGTMFKNKAENLAYTPGIL